MKTNDTPKMQADETGFLLTLIVALLIIVPMLDGHLGKYGGGIVMLAGSVLGMIAYLVMFRNRLRRRGQLKAMALIAGTSFVAGAAAAAGLGLFHAPWNY